MKNPAHIDMIERGDMFIQDGADVEQQPSTLKTGYYSCVKVFGKGAMGRVGGDGRAEAQPNNYLRCSGACCTCCPETRHEVRSQPRAL